MIAQIVVPDIDPLTLDSIFESPGRNDPCHCASGTKYKRCCLPSDEEMWRMVARWRKDAETVLEMLQAMPKSIYRNYNLEPQ